jgi:hypothetical protein
MFPPLPPFPPPYQPRQHMHMAMRMPPPLPQQQWYAPYTYGKSFVPVPPLRRQPFAPRGATPNMPSRRVNNAPPLDAARKVTAETRAIDKENQPPADPPRDENARKPSYARVLKADAKPFKMREPQSAWPIKSTRESPTVPTCNEKKSIWTVTELDLTTMMLLAHGKRMAPRQSKPQIKKPLRSNQDTHEWDRQSDGSSAASSDTDTEDDDVPGLKKCYGFPFLVEFPCDGEGDQRFGLHKGKAPSDYTNTFQELKRKFDRCGQARAIFSVSATRPTRRT